MYAERPPATIAIITASTIREKFKCGLPPVCVIARNGMYSMKRSIMAYIPVPVLVKSFAKKPSSAMITDMMIVSGGISPFVINGYAALTIAPIVPIVEVITFFIIGFLRVRLAIYFIIPPSKCFSNHVNGI